MNFKQALIAHLQGERVEVRGRLEKQWESFVSRCGYLKIEDICDNHGGACEFRIAPSTIRVNGVEVPAPEKVAPTGGWYVVPTPNTHLMNEKYMWYGNEADLFCLSRGLVYLNKEDAIARAKAMLLTKE